MEDLVMFQAIVEAHNELECSMSASAPRDYVERAAAILAAALGHPSAPAVGDLVRVVDACGAPSAVPEGLEARVEAVVNSHPCDGAYRLRLEGVPGAWWVKVQGVGT